MTDKQKIDNYKNFIITKYKNLYLRFLSLNEETKSQEEFLYNAIQKYRTYMLSIGIKDPEILEITNSVRYEYFVRDTYRERYKQD